MILSGQIMPHMLKLDSFQHLENVSDWLLALPPMWFGALDALIGGTTLNPATLWLPAALAVIVTAVTSWLRPRKTRPRLRPGPHEPQRVRRYRQGQNQAA
jgi:hypothetical protein